MCMEEEGGGGTMESAKFLLRWLNSTTFKIVLGGTVSAVTLYFVVKSLRSGKW